MSTENKKYAQPHYLVTTEWVEENLDNDQIRIVESNEDPLLYPMSHIPGSVQIDWTRDLNDQKRRDYLDEKSFQELMAKNGISNDTTVIFYGDKNNWWACYAFWVFQLFGHKNAKIMNGGRLKWEKEGRPMTKEKPSIKPAEYSAKRRDDSTDRAFRMDVLEHLSKGLPLVDVRSKEEFTGERMHMPEYPNEGALRGGHIPGALSIPWSMAVNPDDGTFKSAEDLNKIYSIDNNLTKDVETIAYCRIGERSSHTWFVLKYLLGFENIRNYDGSWTEWGNLVGVPIEK